jgi:hypothetical protein
MSQQELDDIHNSVRYAYGKVAGADDNGRSVVIPG